MKKLTAILLLAAFVLLSCAAEEIPEQESITEESVVSEESKQLAAENEMKITAVNDLIQLENVLEVKELDKPGNNTVGFNVLFTTGENQVEADFILPCDYATAAGSFPVMLYCPQIGYDNTQLAKEFAEQGIIVVRIGGRNSSNSVTEGQKDLGGEDLIDLETLLAILEKADFLEGAKIYTAGASEGSVRSLRLAQLHGDSLAGCAVIDVIPDLQSLAEYRGEGIINYMSALLGGTYEVVPEEYEKRSAIYFYDEIDIPVYFMNYTENTNINLADTEKLYLAMKDAGKDVQYMLFEKNGADFAGDPAPYLIEWMKG